MTSLEIAIVGATTILGPILAVQAQKFIEKVTERRRAQLQVFYELMATRATRLAPEHVQALNRIELEFRGRGAKEKAVRDAWRLYADHLNAHLDDYDSAALSSWSTTRETLFTELMFHMSQTLGFDFDRVQLKRGIYYPRGHGELEDRHRAILASLESVLSGKQSIKIENIISKEAAELQLKLTDRMTTAYDEAGALRVRLLSDDGDDSKKR